MSQAQNVKNTQIRRYAALPQNLALGAAAQQVNMDITLDAPTALIQFGAESAVTTVPANDALTAVWLLGIQIIINQTEAVVPMMIRQDYINLVQNTEMKEAAIISNGEMIYKKFDPPLPAGSKIQITLLINTLALGTTTPAATANLVFACYTYDSLKPFGNTLTHYATITNFPQPAGVVVGTWIDQPLGVNARIEKALVIISENPVGTPVDTYLGQALLLANGNTVMSSSSPAMKTHYTIMSDGIAAPAGWHVLKCPAIGFNTSFQRQLSLRVLPYVTVAGGQLRGYEIFDKEYITG